MYALLQNTFLFIITTLVAINKDDKEVSIQRVGAKFLQLLIANASVINGKLIMPPARKKKNTNNLPVVSC